MIKIENIIGKKSRIRINFDIQFERNITDKNTT